MGRSITMRVENKVTRVDKDTTWEKRAERVIGTRAFWGVLFLSLGLLLASATAVSAVRVLTQGEKTLLPQGIPDAALSLPFFSDYYELSAEEKYMVGVCGQNTTLKVMFSKMTSFGGRWNGSMSRLILTLSSQPDVFPLVLQAETHNDNWGDTLYGDWTDSTITPWLKLNLPIEAEYYHNWIEVEARMTIVFPQSNNRTHFSNNERVLVRNFSFFVVSPDERPIMENRNEWGALEREKEENWVVALISAIMVSVGAFLIYSGFRGGDLARAKNLMNGSVNYSEKSRKAFWEQTTNRCTKCGASYSSQLGKCPYCGQE